MSPMNARRGKRLVAEMNVVPYIDVMLVLLIIFMITAPMLTQGIKVDLPKAASEPLPEDMMRQHQPVILSIDAGGQYYLNDGDEKKTLGEDEVVARVRSVLTRTKDTPVLVKADTNVPYGRVVTGMVLLQEAGAEKVGFITDPAEARNNKKR